MITRRIVVNLIAFAVVATALVAYGLFDLLGNPFAKTTTVSAIVPSASGLQPHFLVTLRGVDVGSVASVSLVPNGAKVTMTLDPHTRVPSDVAARVVIANPLGEQEVQLVPQANPSSSPGRGVLAASTRRDATAGDSGGQLAALRASAPSRFLHNGAVIPATPDSTPAEVGTIVAEATRLLQAIPPGSLNDLLHESALALQGNAGSLRTIASASAIFSEEFLAQQQQFESLLANSPPVLDTVTQNAGALRRGLADTAVMAQLFANKANDLVRLFRQGSEAAAALQALVVENEPNLACVVHDNANLAANLGSSPNLQNLSTALSINQNVFGALKRLAVTGPAIALTKNDTARPDQEWLRSRLLIPPLQVPTEPQPMQYAVPTRLPPVLPGAGCDTEFGQGAGPVSQANFHPIGPDARVVPPTAAEARVRGGGTEPPAASAARVRPGPSSVVLPILVGLVAVGWLVTLGHRRRGRSARPMRPVSHSARGGRSLRCPSVRGPSLRRTSAPR